LGYYSTSRPCIKLIYDKNRRFITTDKKYLSFDFLESPDELTIKYWDALKSNPEYWDGTENKPYVAGTLYFKIVNGRLLYLDDNSTIKLIQIK
jgi:hypothetical protein